MAPRPHRGNHPNQIDYINTCFRRPTISDCRQAVKRNLRDVERLDKRIANSQKDLVSMQKAIAGFEARLLPGALARVGIDRTQVEILKLKHSCVLLEEHIASLQRERACCLKANEVLRSGARRDA